MPTCCSRPARPTAPSPKAGSTAGGALDGVVAKRRDGPYEPGERAMLKVKAMRTADCVVGGFRYGTGSKEVGSLLLGLYDEAGLLDHVGFTSSIPPASAALTRRLEALIEPPGFTGDAPGRAEPLVDRALRRLAAAAARAGRRGALRPCHRRRFRHGTKFLRWRPDKAPEQCRMDQLQPEARPDALAAELRAAS
jgi:ATP-dependent DNA ligase